MNKKNKSTYGAEIKKKYNTDGHLYLPEITSLNIKNRCLTLLKEDLSHSDKNILVSFLKIKDDLRLQEIISKIDIDKFKPIGTFLTSKKYNFRYDEAYDFSAFIVGFTPRPYSKYLKNGFEETEEIEATTPNTKKQLSEIEINGLLKLVNPLYIGLILVILLTSIWILNGLFFNTLPEPVPQTIIYNTYNGNLNYYYTKKDNGEIVLYKNTDGLPNNTFKPVTQKVILTYFKQKNIDVSNEDTKRWFKEEIGGEILKQNSNETTNTKKHVKPLSNLAVQNTKVTIKSNKDIDNIMSVYFKNTYKKTTLKYIATGNVSYTFKESSFIKDATVCKLVLTYNVKLINSDTLFDLNTITSTATGFSMLDAKNKAIDKLQFN